MTLYRNATLLFLLTIFTTINCIAQSNYKSPFKLDFTKEAVIIGSGTAAGIAALALVLNISPLTAEEINALDRMDVNKFDRSAIGTKSTENTGDALLYAAYLLPLTFLAYEETNRDFWNLAFMYGEVILVTGSVNGVVKGIVKRTRPYVYDGNTPLEEKTTRNARVSFYSGHTAMTSAVTFFTASVFTTYISDKTAQILIWSAAVIYPALTGYLRVSSANHFPSDVITGYLVGAGIGILIPLLHKVENENGFSLYPVKYNDGGGLSLTLQF